MSGCRLARLRKAGADSCRAADRACIGAFGRRGWALDEQLTAHALARRGRFGRARDERHGERPRAQGGTLAPCRALSLSLSHTHTHKSGQREGICALSLISLGSGRRSVNERRERRRVVLHGWVAAALSKSYRARGCCGDLKPDYETPMQRRRRCAAAPGGERRERYLRDACRAGGSRQLRPGAGCVGSCSGPREYARFMNVNKRTRGGSVGEGAAGAARPTTRLSTLQPSQAKFSFRHRGHRTGVHTGANSTPLTRAPTNPHANLRVHALPLVVPAPTQKQRAWPTSLRSSPRSSDIAPPP